MHSAWTSAKLGAIASVLASNVDKHVHEDEVPVRLCNYLDVYRNRRLSNPYEFSRGSVTEAERDRFTVRKGDVLITKDSEAPDDIGVPCLIADDFENTVCGYHLALIRTKEDLNPSFLSYLFQSEPTRRYFLAKAAGLTRFGLNARTIRAVPIPLPLPDEQAAVANVLDAVECAIVKARDVIEKAEHLQKGVMQQLLTGRLKPDGTPRPEADFDSDDRLGLFPKGWKVRKLRQAVRLRNGKSNITANLRTEADAVFCFPVFGGNGMTGWSDRYLLESPTVVLGRVGEYCGVVHRTPAKAWITDNALYACEFPEPTDLGFLFYLLTHLQLNRWKAITGQPKITQSEILNIRVAMPSDTNEQASIAAKLDCVRQLIGAKEQRITALKRLKKSLMQNLLTGRIRLPVKDEAKEATA